MTGALSGVHLQHFTGDKAGGFQKHHGIDNVLHLAHSPKWMKFGERLVHLWRTHRCRLCGTSYAGYEAVASSRDVHHIALTSFTVT
jgi:hypothetical protein